MLRIKEVAKEKDISINELADKLGISRVTLHSQMNGNPTVETLQKIADVLEVEISELFKKETDASFQKCPHCGGDIKLKIE
jgi:Predicted transcriptional regulators